jgi:hypothetical protein
MIYEYRAYYVLPGRKKALLDRFANHTMGLFKKHGIQVVGFWDTDIGESNEVVYLCAFADLNQRQAAWASFRADPEWQAVVRTSEADGPIVDRVVNKIWSPVPFSPLQ